MSIWRAHVQQEDAAVWGDRGWHRGSRAGTDTELMHQIPSVTLLPGE